MSRRMWNNQEVATAVFPSEVTIHRGKKYEPLDASLFFQSD